MIQLRAFPMLIPPISIQLEFARRIEDIENLAVSTQTHMDKLDSLFSSLQHRAFRGELLSVRFEFDWDPATAESNLGKHGVSFEEAMAVFHDPLALSRPDEEHGANEERWVTLGRRQDARPPFPPCGGRCRAKRGG
jgi:ribonuclease toxin BrnT of type II toxin-antitoxin system